MITTYLLFRFLLASLTFHFSQSFDFVHFSTAVLLSTLWYGICAATSRRHRYRPFPELHLKKKKKTQFRQIVSTQDEKKIVDSTQHMTKWKGNKLPWFRTTFMTSVSVFWMWRNWNRTSFRTISLTFSFLRFTLFAMFTFVMPFWCSTTWPGSTHYFGFICYYYALKLIFNTFNTQEFTIRIFWTRKYTQIYTVLNQYNFFSIWYKDTT